MFSIQLKLFIFGRVFFCSFIILFFLYIFRSFKESYKNAVNSFIVLLKQTFYESFFLIFSFFFLFLVKWDGDLDFKQ